MTFVIALAVFLVALGVALTLWGVWALAQARGRGTAPLQQTKQAVVTLEGVGPLSVEPGVLLNTLWAHLPNAECQAGECGGCKVALLEGRVTWLKEPVADVNRNTHFLACSCVASGDIRCAVLTD